MARRPTQAVLDSAGAGAASQGRIARLLSEPVMSVADLLVHELDLTVTPLIDNPKIAKVNRAKFDPKALKFTPHTAKQWQSMQPEDIAEHLREITTALEFEGGSRATSRGASRGSSAPGSGRGAQHTLAYLMTVSRTAFVANQIANSPLYVALPRLLKAAPDATCRTRYDAVIAIHDMAVLG